MAVAGKGKVLCVIPTLNGGSELLKLLSVVKKNKLLDLLVLDSCSSDNTRDGLEKKSDFFETVNADFFDHGGTRQFAVDKYSEYGFFVFLTQDVELDSPCAIDNLISEFKCSSIGAAYGRQLPKKNSTPFAAFLRCFNYPSNSRVQSLQLAPLMGLKTAFISNAFAIYRKEALRDAGGFPKETILGEDIYVAARMLEKGWAISYVATACCYHSHNYSIIQECKRYFDIGVFHSRESWILERFGGVNREGTKFVCAELKYLGWRRSYLWPLSLVRNAGKFLFYKLGRMEKRIPLWLKLKISMNRRFWLR